MRLVHLDIFVRVVVIFMGISFLVAIYTRKTNVGSKLDCLFPCRATIIFPWLEM
jgi:hypothetical protein